MRSYFTIRYDNEDTVTYEWPTGNKRAFFREVAAHIAMCDYTDEEILRIVYDKKVYKTSGWNYGQSYSFIMFCHASRLHYDAYTLWLPEHDH